MKPKYSDILSRIPTEPIWYGRNGEPRYDPFQPRLSSNIYAVEVILLKIQCQSCKKPFLVEMHHTKPSDSASLEYRVINNKNYFLNPVHYGDPPRHDDPRENFLGQDEDEECVGNTMNAESLQIVEFWKKYDKPIKKCRIRLR
ncbi:MAG: hypothetical protein ACTSRK_16905 [Promethearchaeota archaeon]